MSVLKKNIIYNFAGQVLLILLGIISVKIIFKDLGKDVLGIIFFSTLLNTILYSTLEMGINTTVVKEIASNYRIKNNYIKFLIKTSSLFYWSALSLLGLVIYFLAPWIVNSWVILEDLNKETAILIFRILGISALTIFPRGLYSSIFRGIQKMQYYNIIDVTTTAAQQFGIIVILFSKGSLILVVSYIAAWQIFRIIIYLILLKKFFPMSAFLPGYSKSIMKKNKKFALNMFSITIMATIQAQLDKIIISKFLPLGYLGYYNFAYSNISKVNLISSSVSQAILPDFSEKFNREKNTDVIVDQYKKIVEIICFGIVPLFAFIIFSMTPIYTFIFNFEIAEKLFWPMLILCIGFYMSATFSIPYNFSLAINKPEIVSKMNLLAFLLLTPITFILVYRFGLIGAAISWVNYHIFVYSYGIPRVYRECLNLNIRHWFTMILKVVFISGICYALIFIVFQNHFTQNILNIGICFTLSSLLYVPMAFFLMGKPSRNLLLNIFNWKNT